MSEDQIQEAPVEETPTEAPAPATETTPESTPAPETESSQAEATSDETSAEAPVDEPEKEEKPKSRFQERIDNLTRQKYEAERRSRDLEEKLKMYESRPVEEVDEDDYEAIERARQRQVYREEQKFEVDYEVNRVKQEAIQAQGELFRAKVDAARDRIPDLMESLAVFADCPISDDSAAIIADSPKAAEIAHFLGRNPDKALELYRMSPVQQGHELARIEHRVTLPAKKASSAPPPPATIKSTAAIQAKDPSEMTASEYVAWRKAQWKSET